MKKFIAILLALLVLSILPAFVPSAHAQNTTADASCGFTRLESSRSGTGSFSTNLNIEAGDMLIVAGSKISITSTDAPWLNRSANSTATYWVNDPEGTAHARYHATITVSDGYYAIYTVDLGKPIEPIVFTALANLQVSGMPLRHLQIGAIMQERPACLYPSATY